MAAERSFLMAGAARQAGLLASVLTLVVCLLAAQTFLVWVALAGLVTLLMTGGRIAWWPATATALLLAVVNSLKWPESDLAEYFVILDSVKDLSLGVLLDDESALMSIRPTEPVFRTLLWLVARADPLPRITFALFGGIAVYGALLWLCRRASTPTWSGDTAWQAAIATTIALLIGVTFSLVGHLVRQYIAGGLFFIGVFGWALTGRWRWWLWPAIACATHNSALLLVVPLIVSALLAFRPRLFMAVALVVLGASLAGQIPFVSEMAEATSFLKEDGQIGLALPLLDSAVLLVTWLVWRKLPTQDRPAPDTTARMLCFGVSLAVVLFCIREVPLLFFRSYFYLEFLRAPMLAFVIAAALRHAGKAAVPGAVLALPLAALLCWQRVRSADWSYGAEHAPWSEWLDMQSVLLRWQSIQSSIL